MNNFNLDLSIFEFKILSTSFPVSSVIIISLINGLSIYLFKFIDFNKLQISEEENSNLLLDEFDVYNDVQRKIEYDTQNDLPDRRINYIYRDCNRQEEIIEDLIIDYLYANQNEFFNVKKRSKSLLSGCEGYESLKLNLKSDNKDYLLE